MNVKSKTKNLYKIISLNIRFGINICMSSGFFTYTYNKIFIPIASQSSNVHG